MDVIGKVVVVVGLQRSGVSAARLAVARGAARVIGVDVRPDLPPIPGVELQLGPHRRETFLGADLIVASPGVPPSQADVAAARSAGVPILGELQFAASFLPDATIVAITGTNGKSTVTAFTGALLDAWQPGVFIGGNLGVPLSEAALAPVAPRIVVVEVSSYMLEWGGPFRPHAAVILNLTPDHLARHGTMAQYAAEKAKLLADCTAEDLVILPADGVPGAALIRAAAAAWPAPRRLWLGATPGIVRQGRRATVSGAGLAATLNLEGLRVQGAHNLDNAAVAATLALAVGAPLAGIHAALPSLVALPHRVELVHEADGVLWIDDSKATNVEAAAVGIGGMERPAVVLLGGEAKGPGFDALGPLLVGHRVVAFGAAAEQVITELGAVGVRCERAAGLADAVARARALARPGDVVLLSPACASFDEFRNFEHRGQVFRALARGEVA